MNPNAPQDYLHLDNKQVDNKYQDKAIVLSPEFIVILFQRINSGK